MKTLTQWSVISTLSAILLGFDSVSNTTLARYVDQEKSTSPVHTFYFESTNVTIVRVDLMLGGKIPNSPGPEYLIFKPLFTSPGKRIHVPKDIHLTFSSYLGTWQEKYKKAPFQFIVDGRTIVQGDLSKQRTSQGVEFMTKIPFKLFKEMTEGHSVKIVFEEFTFDLTNEEVEILRALIKATET